MVKYTKKQYKKFKSKSGKKNKTGKRLKRSDNKLIKGGTKLRDVYSVSRIRKVFNGFLSYYDLNVIVNNENQYLRRNHTADPFSIGKLLYSTSSVDINYSLNQHTIHSYCYIKIITEDSYEKLNENVKILFFKNSDGSYTYLPELMKSFYDKSIDIRHINDSEKKNIYEEINDEKDKRVCAELIELFSPESKIYKTYNGYEAVSYTHLTLPTKRIV